MIRAQCPRLRDKTVPDPNDAQYAAIMPGGQFVKKKLPTAAP
jgi:hypothetical protein